MKDHKTILVVEDEMLLRKTFQHLLSLWGYSPLCVESGAAALEIATHNELDLILLDYLLPDINGFKVLKRLKQEFLTAYIPVIFLIEKRSFRRDLLKEEVGPDDYLMKPVDPLDLRLRIEMVLHRTEEQFHANPLTKLPGNLAIEKEIEKRLNAQQPLSVCYFDIDHFKAFNDAYGYHRGNEILLQTARIIVQTVKGEGSGSDFVGHIGGDDFIVLSTPEKEEALCRKAIHEFDRLIPLHYREGDRKKGALSVTNRLGKMEQFPITSLSIAVVNNTRRDLKNALQISEVASEIKKFLKNRYSLQSMYFIDRRSESPTGKESRSDAFLPEPVLPMSKKLSKPLGQLLVESKRITSEQLEEALSRHWRSSSRLGQVLLEMNLIDTETLSRFLSDQLGVPYLKVGEQSPTEELKGEFPAEWLQENGVFPVEKKGRVLSLAMINPLDRKIIEWIEKKTGCEVQPFLTMEKELEAQHQQKQDKPHEP